MTREEIRNAIFTATTARTLTVDAFGTTIEVRQPSLGEILELQELPDTRTRVAYSLINYCFVPGTQEKLFDAADMDIILGLPFDENLEAVQNAIVDLTGIDVDAEKGN